MAANPIEFLSALNLMPMLQPADDAAGLHLVYALSSLVTAAALFSVGTALAWFLRRRVSKTYNAVFTLFVLMVFIAAITCAVTPWSGWAKVSVAGAVMRTLLAASATFFAVVLWPLLRRMAPLPGRLQLQQEIERHEHELAERRNIEEALRRSQATLRELAAYQEKIREDERKRIAREIHDELGQNLLALRLDIAALHERAGERHPLLRERAGTALEYLDMTLKSIRTIMNNLRPSVLDLGLPAAIEWQVGQFERRSGVRCELLMNDEVEADAVPDEQAIAVFRILQESLNNISRHARASLVRVEMRIDAQRLSMAIMDNGVGMYPGDRRKVRRFGLVGIEERVTILGGELAIDSTPGQGTVVRLSIPMRRRPDLHPLPGTDKQAERDPSLSA
ncbi:MAG TPA: sensor histidine kinase [Noviherbaspirillum sp.]|uniref:sensor histidine kinase n=1 Tax=Noviherbaspirillum sp. TaxID=1926288 RepID=UPI002F92524A